MRDQLRAAFVATLTSVLLASCSDASTTDARSGTSSSSGSESRSAPPLAEVCTPATRGTGPSFVFTDPDGQAFESFALDTHRGVTVQAYVGGIMDQIQAANDRAHSIVRQYDQTVARDEPTQAVAAFVASGWVYEVLAHAIVSAQHPLPEDLEHQIAHASPAVRAEIAAQYDARIRQAMEAQIAPLECFAVVRYVLAARAARASALETDAARVALDRLEAYGDVRIGPCVEAHRAYGWTLPALTPGEFARRCAVAG